MAKSVRPSVCHILILYQNECCKLSGVIFQSNFKMDSHVHYIISQCAQRMYLLKLLRHQGMSGEQLSVVTYSIIYLVFYMLYQRGADFCLPSLQMRSMPFLGASSDLVTRLASCNITFTVSDLIDTSGRDLFRKLCSSEHSLTSFATTREKV